MITVYLYSGDLHEVFAGKKEYASLPEAMNYISEAIETGMMVNILHSDFEIPAHRLQEAQEAQVVLASERRLQ